VWLNILSFATRSLFARDFFYGGWKVQAACCSEVNHVNGSEVPKQRFKGKGEKKEKKGKAYTIWTSTFSCLLC
jgi:hypothetical protein